jgi:hypothetical protein
VLLVTWGYFLRFLGPPASGPLPKHKKKTKNIKHCFAVWQVEEIKNIGYCDLITVIKKKQSAQKD